MMKTLTVTKNDAGQRLDKFLSKKFKTMPKSLMYKYIRTKYVKRNGKKTAPDVFLEEGDVLTFYIRDEFFDEKKSYSFLKASRDLSVIYEDENILLIDKKPGVIVHQDARYESDALNLRVLRYLFEKGDYRPEESGAFTPALCNRIDRNTGGIVIAAKNAEALRVVNQKIRDREIGKYYLCVVKGVPKKPHAILTAWLKKDETTNTVSVFDKERDSAKKIVTEYTLLNTDGALSLLEVRLHTGRTHQIRAHMAHEGHPLLGDSKYGDKKLNRRYGVTSQLLCSYKIRFDFSSPAGCLHYLDGKSFEVSDVGFTKNKSALNIKVK